MDLVKVYIVQSITAASNNLRLNSPQIEVVALLRELILKSENLGDDLYKMKRVTEFSKIGIRLNEVYTFLTMGKVDFVKVSEKFKEHSQYLIRDLNQLLDSISPEDFKIAAKKMRGERDEEINIDFSKRDHGSSEMMIQESRDLKEKIILEEDENDTQSFKNFEETILKTIKPMDEMLLEMKNNEINFEKVETLTQNMKSNAELSLSKGFLVINNMYSILEKALIKINSDKKNPSKNFVDSMRACLIVIVAIVKGKEVDITHYLNRAEEFGKQFIK